MATDASSTWRNIDSPASAGLHAVPLFHAAWLFAAGIVLAHWLWLRPSLALVVLAPVAALCAVAAIRVPRIAWLPLAALWLLLGAWCAEMEPHPTPAATLDTLSDGLLRTLEGTVIDAAPIRTELGYNPDQNLDQGVDEPSLSAPTQSIDVRVATLEDVRRAHSRNRRTPAAARGLS